MGKWPDVSRCVSAATTVAYKSADACQPTGANTAFGTTDPAAPGAPSVKCIWVLLHCLPLRFFAESSTAWTCSTCNHVYVQAANEHSIPVFYIPRGAQTSPMAASAMQAKVDALFAMYPDGLTIPAMKELVKEVRNSLNHCAQ